MSYNGWKNYETWAVALWIDNEQSTYSYWRERAQELREAAPDREEKYWTEDDYVKFNLADELKEQLNDDADDLLESVGQSASLYSDLLIGALSEVDWSEVAEHYMEE